jgi:hypothetical protein
MKAKTARRFLARNEWNIMKARMYNPRCYLVRQAAKCLRVLIKEAKANGTL